MTYSVDIIAQQLFKTIKGFGHIMVLFTDDGQKTTDPAEARRFYAKDIQMMVNFVVDESTNEIVVNLSADSDIQELQPMMSSIRNLANRYIIEYTVKTFGKSISPKDFAYMAKHTIEEGFSGWHGSARKSMNELDDARIVIKHRKSVDEEKRGARTRQIESIFIENGIGERFKFPSSNITAAKAMLRHVQEGGAPHDDFGQNIYGIMEELNELKTFQRKNKRNDFFEDAAIGEEIGAHIGKLRHSLKSMSGPKGYRVQMESFTTENAEVSQERLDELKDNVTVNYFDESIAGALPYVARIIEGLRNRQAGEKVVAEFARHVMNTTDIPLSEACDDDDPDAPGTQSYKSQLDEIAAWSAYLAPRMQNEELASKMTRMAENVSASSPGHATMAMSAINVIRQNHHVAEASCLASDKDNVEADEINKINETFDKYSVRKIFGV